MIGLNKSFNWPKFSPEQRISGVISWDELGCVTLRPIVVNLTNLCGVLAKCTSCYSCWMFQTVELFNFFVTFHLFFLNSNFSLFMFRFSCSPAVAVLLFSNGRYNDSKLQLVFCFVIQSAARVCPMLQLIDWFGSNHWVQRYTITIVVNNWNTWSKINWFNLILTFLFAFVFFTGDARWFVVTRRLLNASVGVDVIRLSLPPSLSVW